MDKLIAELVDFDRAGLVVVDDLEELNLAREAG